VGQEHGQVGLVDLVGWVGCVHHTGSLQVEHVNTGQTWVF
jgi:hypothetical protein